MANDEINRRVAELEGYEYQSHSPDWSEWYCLSVPDGNGWFRRKGESGWLCAACHGFPPDYCGDAALSQALQEKHGIITWPVDHVWAATTVASNQWATYAWILTPRYDPSLRRAIALARITMEDE